MMHIVLCILCIIASTKAMDNLTVAFQWRKLDFHFRSEEERQTARNTWYTDYNNVPIGLEVHKDRLFITVPRWRAGVAASLAYIKLTDPMDSPKLYPYPNWEAHRPDPGKPREIDSPFRIRADKCGRLWVMDSGYSDILETQPKTSGPKLLIYDLATDELIRTYHIPKNQTHPEDSFFCNVVVEENNCTDSFAYLADLGRPGMVVYSYESNSSWAVKHNYFHPDPLASNMTVGGQNFHWTDGLFGMALRKNPDNYSTLYFHPMISYNEFTVDTRVLRNRTLATDPAENYHHFQLLGSRCAKGQSGSSFYHEKSKVLFYTLLNLDAVACWRTTTQNYTIMSHGRVYVSNKTMIFPSDLKVDENDNLWVLSNQLPVYMMDPQRFEEEYQEYHFRILKSPVSHAIMGTSCDAIIKVKGGSSDGVRVWASNTLTMLGVILTLRWVVEM